MVSGGYLPLHFFECQRQCRRHRIGDEAVPFGADFSGGAENALDKRADAVRVIGRSGLAQQPPHRGIRGRSAIGG